VRKIIADGKPRLSGVALNVTSPANLAAFYCKFFGMSAVWSDQCVRLGYGGQGASLELRPSLSATPYSHDPLDEYWKIGITLPDVDMAFAQLSRAGIEVTAPSQFLDIGYMCHLTDPEGFQIELLQHTFAGHQRTSPGDRELPLGGGAQIGQITLRVTDLDGALTHYRHSMGMRLLSKQVVTKRDFTLYFLAFTDQTPPEKDIQAVQNRPWLWQRKYTTLELQHLTGPGQLINPSINERSGYAGLLFDYVCS
jgi:catechol 2,3-dioxygenase-like lactoylglutathione lyase family enzyme